MNMGTELVKTVGVLLMFAIICTIIAVGWTWTRARIKSLDGKRRESKETEARINALADRIEATERKLKSLNDRPPESKA
jgi:hypothetical protein